MTNETVTVYRAVDRFGNDCHFGELCIAQAWAGIGGTVETRELPLRPELRTVPGQKCPTCNGTGILKTGSWPPCPDCNDGEVSQGPRWRIAIWDAINDYVAACGGNPSKYVYGNTSRQQAVARVERAVKDAQHDAVAEDQGDRR